MDHGRTMSGRTALEEKVQLDSSWCRGQVPRGQVPQREWNTSLKELRMQPGQHARATLENKCTVHFRLRKTSDWHDQRWQDQLAILEVPNSFSGEAGPPLIPPLPTYYDRKFGNTNGVTEEENLPKGWRRDLSG